MTCECGEIVDGSSEKDVRSRMFSHLQYDHADRRSEHKQMMNDAKKTTADTIFAM
jgi:hypothetical protein